MLACLALLIFAATGLFLRANRAELIAAGESVRLLYRARHIHLLTSGLLHLMAGAMYAAQPRSTSTLLHRIGSVLLFAAFPTLLGAFMNEPLRGFGHSRLVLAGMVLQSFGTFACVLATLRSNKG